MILLWLALGCARELPELDPVARAARAYDRGAAALVAGRPADAVDAFVEARAAADSPVLAAWEARARAASGDLDGAERLATAILSSNPGDGRAWYNRAAWRARQGRLTESAADLAEALVRGAATPFSAAEDPDFAPHRRAPEMASVLPAWPVRVAVRGPDGSVFLGSRFDVVVTLEGAPGTPVALRVASEGAGLRLARLIEDRTTADGVERRVLTLQVDAVGPGDARIGPIVAVVAPDGGGPTTTGTIDVRVEAPPGAAAVLGGLPRELPLPCAAMPDEVREVREAACAGGTLALVPVELSAPRGTVTVERRVDGQVRARGAWTGG